LPVESAVGFQYKIGMGNEDVRTPRKMKRFRASRSFRFLLLSLGLTGLVLGCGLLAYGHLRKNGTLTSFALLYVGFSVVTLGLRQAMILLHERGKKRKLRVQKRNQSLRPAVRRPKLNEPL